MNAMFIIYLIWENKYNTIERSVTAKMQQNMENKKPETEETTFTPVFYISAVLVALFVLWGILSPSSLNSVASDALQWMIDTFGWYYMLIAAFFVIFIIGLAISPLGKIRLGDKDERPEFSWFSWVGMLFAAGIGVGFVFWGVAEPVLHYMNPPVGFEPGTSESAAAGLRYGVFHWALHPWAIFSVVGLTLAYVQFRMKKPALISSAFYPLIGDRVEGKLGKAIDILAVLATCTGVATTFGLSALQMSGGISELSSIPNNIVTQIVIIIFVTGCFIFSASTGVDKGIKILSNINIVIAGILLIFVLMIGPTVFILENMVTTLGGYITNFVRMSLTLTPYSDNGWLGANTIFFWAWHISWAPFMGLFIARISRGRTIREFIAGVLIAPSTLGLLWFSTFGATALDIEINGAGGLATLVDTEVELALFATLAELPFGLFTSIVSLILIFIFFITSADSATFVLGSMTSRGQLNPPLVVKLVWGFLIAGTASVLLLSGGGGLDALQTASIIAALPFGIIMILMVISISISLRREWRQHYRPLELRPPEGTTEDQYEGELEFVAVTGEDTDDFYEKVKQNMYDDLKEEVVDDTKGDIKKEIYDDLKDDVAELTKEDLKQKIYDEIHSEVITDVKKDMYNQIKKEVMEDLQKDEKEG